jgi:hypothetical protein
MGHMTLIIYILAAKLHMFFPTRKSYTYVSFQSIPSESLTCICSLHFVLSFSGVSHTCVSLYCDRVHSSKRCPLDRVLHAKHRVMCIGSYTGIIVA